MRKQDPGEKKRAEIVAQYTYMTDRFMSRAMTKKVAEHILSVILGRPVVVESSETQVVADNLHSKSCRFDVFIIDKEGRYYNVEVQNSNEGADPKRAWYNCIKLSEEAIKEGMKYQDYPDICVIFITEKDKIGDGLPIYHIRLQVEETGKLFECGVSIIFVNGEIQTPDTDLGQLMLDMHQSDPDKISNPVMADVMRKLKNPSGKGFKTMCREIEEVEREAMKLGEKNAAVKAAQMVLELGGSKDTAVAKIVEKFGFSFENAKDCVEKAIKN